jgi:hypothetical protein
LGWENEITRNAPHRFARTENPFARQQYLVYELKEQILLHPSDREKIHHLTLEINQHLEDGLELVRYIRDNTSDALTLPVSRTCS